MPVKSLTDYRIDITYRFPAGRLSVSNIFILENDEVAGIVVGWAFKYFAELKKAHYC